MIFNEKPNFLNFTKMNEDFWKNSPFKDNSNSSDDSYYDSYILVKDKEIVLQSDSSDEIIQTYIKLNDKELRIFKIQELELGLV